MPCPHNEISIVQRSQQQSAIAAAAYQSGEKLFCEYDQQVKHYPEKRGIVHNEILLPANAPQKYADRNTLALIVGLPLFFLLKDSAGTSAASFVMIVVMLPCFLMAMYEKHGQPLEVVVKNIIQTKFVRPKERPYQTQNLYAVLEKQRKLEKEVSAIVKGNNQRRRTGKRPRKG